MRRVWMMLGVVWVLSVATAAWGGIFGRVQGVVHDPQHRPVAGARVVLKAAHSSFSAAGVTNQSGAFQLSSVPLGEYEVTIVEAGFSTLRQTVTLGSDSSAVLHFELQVGSVAETVTVTTEPQGAGLETATPTALIGRTEIAETPGAGRTNSMAMITDYVPGAYMTHDMLHIRGGHQVSWLIDGVEIPNTNIGSNVGAQIDPKDIDYLEVERGSYAAGMGDRTYGVFNVVPRTGFERDREGEVEVTAGSFRQASMQVNLGDHTEKLAWYASANGNRSDYGLAPPVAQVLHDAANGYGGFGSAIYNRTEKDQLRLVAQVRADYFQIPYDPVAGDFENQAYDSSGLRDGQHENDALMAFSWLHTFNAATVLQVSPFFHRNEADFGSRTTDAPVATTANRASNYAGAQGSVTTEIRRNVLEAGVYGFGQHDAYLFGAIFNDGSGTAPFARANGAAGGVVAAYGSDTFKATSWLTLIAGIRTTHFEGAFGEDNASPRFGAAVKVPKLNWVVRGFYGRFYQPPPLLTASGPVVDLAAANNTAFVPLYGERDEEHQFGVQIPWRGWVVDADTFKTRVNNFLDHSNVGNSSIYFPVSVDGSLVRAWELTLRTPRGWRWGQGHLAYSNQIAEQRGKITGGLVCAPVASPECDATPGYRPVDHDQRNTLNVGFNAKLPGAMTASTNVYYGSGFTNGQPDAATPYPNAYLPGHTTFDLAVGRRIGARMNVAVNALNVGNRRVLLDNSLTFGGFHYNDPREIYGEVRYRFKF